MKLYSVLLTAAITLLSLFAGAQPWMNQFVDINPDVTSSSSNPDNFYLFNNKLLFSSYVCDTCSWPILMQTDGTTAGTTILSEEAILPHGFTPLNGKLFFIAGWYDDQHIWITDGTTAGTKLFNDARVDQLTLLNGKICFAKYNNPWGQTSLWVTDGTTAGTHEIYMMADAATLFAFKEYNGKLYFGSNVYAGTNSFWVTDGTTAGTKKVKDVSLSYFFHTTGYPVFRYVNIIVYNGKMYFPGYEDFHGSELWESDGTEAGTKMVYDINPGFESSNPRYFTQYHNKLAFVAMPSINDDRLWIADGVSNPQMLSPLPVYDEQYKMGNNTLATFNDKLYVQLNAGLAISDGTTNGTSMLKDSLVYKCYTINNGYFYFMGTSTKPNDEWYDMYRLDTNNNIIQLRPILYMPPNNTTNTFGKLGQSIFFGATQTDYFNQELWKIGDFPTNIQQPSPADGLTIFPNPTTGSFSITNAPAETLVRIYSLTGQVVSENFTATDIDIAFLPAGVYNVAVINKNSTIWKQLVKQ